jgi:hypothetical protein
MRMRVQLGRRARQNDVDALYGFLRETHPALFHHDSRATIEAELEKLRAVLPRLSWPECVVGSRSRAALPRSRGRATFRPRNAQARRVRSAAQAREGE